MEDGPERPSPGHTGHRPLATRCSRCGLWAQLVTGAPWFDRRDKEVCASRRGQTEQRWGHAGGGPQGGGRPRPLHGEGLKMLGAGTGWRAVHRAQRGQGVGEVTGVVTRGSQERWAEPSSERYLGLPS